MGRKAANEPVLNPHQKAGRKGHGRDAAIRHANEQVDEQDMNRC
jgi:hypothetical protein